MTEQVDLVKLAEWAGFTWSDRHKQWFSPTNIGFLELPDFTDYIWGIAYCFKWLEPPLYERFGIYHIGFSRVKGVGYNCFMNKSVAEWPYREEGRSKELTTVGTGESLGAAFCDAAWKVIHRYSEQLIDKESND